LVLEGLQSNDTSRLVKDFKYEDDEKDSHNNNNNNNYNNNNNTKISPESSQERSVRRRPKRDTNSQLINGKKVNDKFSLIDTQCAKDCGPH